MKPDESNEIETDGDALPGRKDEVEFRLEEAKRRRQKRVVEKRWVVGVVAKGALAHK